MVRWGRMLSYAFLVIFMVWSILPVVWTVLSSFKTQIQIYDVALLFTPTIDNWISVISGEHAEVVKFYANSLIIATASTAIALFLGFIASYAFSRFNIKRSNDLLFFIFSQRIIPAAAIILPLYILFRYVGLLDTYWALILPYSVINLTFSVWMLKSFLDDISPEVEDAALLDGATLPEVLREIVAPQISGGIVATGVFLFAMTINEFFIASVLTGTYARPVSVAVVNFLPTGMRGALYGPACAVAILMALPSIVTFILFRKYMVRGFTLGIVRR